MSEERELLERTLEVVGAAAGSALHRLSAAQRPRVLLLSEPLADFASNSSARSAPDLQL